MLFSQDLFLSSVLVHFLIANKKTVKREVQIGLVLLKVPRPINRKFLLHSLTERMCLCKFIINFNHLHLFLGKKTKQNKTKQKQSKTI